MRKKQEIIELFRSYQADVNNKNDYSNHWIRRFFRCFIDGSYKGEKHYRMNLEFIHNAKDNRRKMRAFVIGSMLDFLNIEYPEISRSTIQKGIIEALSKDELEALNNELIEDAKDLLN